MKNLILKVVAYFIYVMLSAGMFFIAYEYIYDIFTDFLRFQATHSLVKNYADLIIFIIWCSFTVIIVQIARKKILFNVKKSTTLKSDK